jgi:putative ABC transport system permease protein
MEESRGYHFFLVAGQLRSGVSLQQGQAEMDRIAHNIRASDPKHAVNLAFKISSYSELVTGPVRPVFLALVAGLGLVLLIACANVANLMIARCLSRQQEFAVRAALGAPRSRLARQMIVEGGLLSALGCGLGFFLAWLMLAAVHRLPPGTIPRAEEISLHWSVALILAAIATLTTVLSSLLPALLVARTDPQQALQAASRGLGTRSVNRRLSNGLVAGEVALSALLLISAGLLFRTLWNLEHTRLGFDVARVTSFSAMPADAAGFGNMAVSQDTAHAPASVASLVYEPVLERLRHLPGVQDAALMTAPPLSGIDMHTSFTVVGHPEDEAHKFEARMSAVSGGYARLMGTPVISGRMIGAQDGTDAPFVMVVNQALANKYFARENPIGKQVDMGGKDTGMLRPYTIVGILGDQVDSSVARATQPLILLPMSQIPTTSLFYSALLKTIVNFVVKTRGDIAVAPEARAVFRQLAPEYALDNFQTMQQAVDQSNFASRLGLYLTGGFAGLAVLMVVAGLYGVLAQLVSYRRREIGVRLALGSTRSGVLRMVLRQGSVLVAAGLAVGIVLAISTGRLLTSFLYEVKPSDVWTYASVIVLLLAVGGAASLLPALHAATIQPMEALRDE